MNRPLKQIAPAAARDLVAEGAILVDVREASEQAIERIPGSIELPLSRLAHGMPANLPDASAAIFLCTSGARTERNQVALAEIAGGEAYCLSGGIVAWKRAGLPTVNGRS